LVKGNEVNIRKTLLYFILWSTIGCFTVNIYYKPTARETLLRTLNSSNNLAATLGILLGVLILGSVIGVILFFIWYIIFSIRKGKEEVKKQFLAEG